VLGESRSPVNGTCDVTGDGATAGAGPINWYAGVYGAPD
jgi:hypothetical protein